MSIMPQWKICPRCHKRYDWNPDVGVMRCPYCMEKDMKRVERLKNILFKEKDEKSNETTVD